MHPDPVDLALPRLLDSLKSPHRARRLKAAAILGKVADPVALPALAAALGDEDVHVRKLAALALGDLGPDAAAAVPALARALTDADAGVRRRVVVALGDIGTDEALAAVQAASGDADEGVRRAAGNVQKLRSAA